MAEDDDKDQKTEDPSHRKLEEALKKGQVASSREINNFLLLFAFVLCLLTLGGPLARDFTLNMSAFITKPDQLMTDEAGLGGVMSHMLQQLLAMLAPLMLALIVAALAAGLLQKPLVLSADPIKPKLEKISLKKGFQRLFSARSIIEFIKSIVKITIVGLVCFYAIYPQLGPIRELPGSDIETFLSLLIALATRLLIAVCIAVFFIAVLDYLYQRYEYIKNLRMSKQELKDEYKQQEGDPQIKAKLRQLRIERSRRRMMAAVPTADVVITNPTHFAVALAYDAEAMTAPKVVAKGQDNIAFKIREIAEENDVPVVENPPLARALFASAEIDEEVPYEHFRAVAEVIGYVYRLKGKTFGGPAKR